WVLTSITLDGKQIYPEQPSLFSRIASFFSTRSSEPVALSDDESFEQLYNVVETHNAEVVFSHEDGSTDTGNRIQLTTTLNGVGTISPSRLFVAERDGDEVIEWNIPDTYDVEGVYARVGDTAILTSVPATDNSVTINDILTALNIQESDYEFVTAIEFIVNTKPKSTPTSVEPAKYNLTTSIDDGGNITSSMNNIEEGEVITVSWSTDETQWISKVIIDGVERPDLVEENSVDLTMDQDHSVEVKLNLAESTYYVDYYKQMIDGEYVLISSIPFASRVNTAVGINEEDISVPEGYGLNTDKSVISGTVTGASKPLHLSIYFDKYVDLVVEYVDEAGIAVADGYRETYKLLDSYKTEDAAPYGYELLATPDNASGKMTDEVVVVTYTYALKDTSVLVNYVDENGNKIPDSIIKSEEITGRVFDSYDTTAREIFGYDLIETPDNASGEMQEEQIVVNYVYRLKDTSVLLMFVNEDREEISESRLIDGKVYDDYSEKALDILDEVLASDDAYGYELVEYPQLAYNGKMSEEQIVVVYNFKIKDTSVIVKHINESGEEIAPSATIEGKVFDAFDTNHLDDIYGYTFKDVKVERLSEQSLLRAVRSVGARFIALFAAEDEETTAPSDYSGIMEEDVIVVSYIYEIKDACVVVKYVDENGNELDRETISGKVFDDYNTEQKAIYAYEFVSSSDNTSGEMTEDEITVIYTYKQVLNIDTDGDGEPDINIDTDGDGEPDINIDTDDDGEPDINIDTDDEGKPDITIDNSLLYKSDAADD
ncbi:MAG: MucBP domain-containing protein, partial [Eubacterium sp.]|nr:MucBP domain-containing protein [Eubacterium sp.]